MFHAALRVFFILSTVFLCHGARALEAPPQSEPDKGSSAAGLLFGGMGGPIFKAHNMGDGMVYGIGGRGAMSIMGIFLLGGGGFGTIAQGDIKVGSVAEQVSLGYGGLGVGFKIFPSAFIHISSFNMVSIGRIGLLGRGESSHCFVFEPELNAEFTLVSFLRFGLGATYRYVIAKSISVSSNDLSGFGGQAYIEFGWL